MDFKILYTQRQIQMSRHFRLWKECVEIDLNLTKALSLRNRRNTLIL